MLVAMSSASLPNCVTGWGDGASRSNTKEFALLFEVVVLVDEVLLNKPALFVTTINDLFGEGTAFYYIVIIALTVIFLRFTHFLFGVIINKIFTTISKHVTFEIRKKLILHLKNVCMNEYESLGSGIHA